MIETIVTGVDGSETARSAATTAARLATSFNARLHLLSAYGPSESRSHTDAVNKVTIDFREDAERVAAEAAAFLNSQFSELEITWSVAAGRPADALVNEAQRLDGDLIVVGNKRVQGPTRFLGSVARSVAASASCDLYVANTHQR